MGLKSVFLRNIQKTSLFLNEEEKEKRQRKRKRKPNKIVSIFYVPAPTSSPFIPELHDCIPAFDLYIAQIAV